ncbi:DUF2214 domain-containing protein [Verticiella sediminum]|uniref:DUF2214 domain-containing protein n=2 Tax=Verticiella sediminum TaxID=1247510 RepID=A0A556AZP2_9BURK|nr:DUF2214 domain-containing protein [Verticiella sediminum]
MLAQWPGATWLQSSSTAYLFVNAAHILGIGLVLGAILPLDLRLIAGRGGEPLRVLAPWLSRVGAVGVLLAILTGAWLYTVRPVDYLHNAAFLYKLALLALALLNVAWQHTGTGMQAVYAGRSVPTAVRVRAAISLCAWLSALVAGRWIGFL